MQVASISVVFLLVANSPVLSGAITGLFQQLAATGLDGD